MPERTSMKSALTTRSRLGIGVRTSVGAAIFLTTCENPVAVCPDSVTGVPSVCTYSCSNGTAASGTPSSNAERCVSCNSGWYLIIMQQRCVNELLTNVDNVPDAGSLGLLNAISVTTATIGTATYLFVAGEIDNGVSVFSINE